MDSRPESMRRSTSSWLVCVALFGCADAGTSKQTNGASQPSSTAPVDPQPRAEASAPPPASVPTLTRLRVPEVSAFDVLELPLGWAVPTLAGSSSINAEFAGQRIAVQQDGIYLGTTHVADLAAADPRVQPEDVEALSLALAAVRDPEKPIEQAQLFVDPRLPAGTVLRVLATAKRSGWLMLGLVVTDAPTTRYATGELMPPPPPPPMPTRGWFDVVIDLGDAEIRIGKVGLTGAAPKSGDSRGLGPVEWLAPEPRGTDELDRLARRLDPLMAELRKIDPEGMRVVHISTGIDRPFAELIAVRPIAEAPICPPGEQRVWHCDRSSVVMRAGPPPLPAIEEIVPDSWGIPP